MVNNFATLLINNEELSLVVFKPSKEKVELVKAIKEKIADPRDHKLIQKTLHNIRTQNSDLPDKLFAVWPEYKTLTGVFSGISNLTEHEIAQKVKDKYSLTSQEVEANYQPIDDENSQVTVYPSETKDLYLKYAKELQMEFQGFVPVVLGMEKFAQEKKGIIALKLPEQYIIAAVKDSGIYYTETVSSPDPVEFVTRLTKAIDFVRNKKEYQIEVSKVTLIGFPKSPEIKLPSKITVTRKPISVNNLTAESKSLYLDSILSARLVVKNLPQEPVHENEEENPKDKDLESSEDKTPAHQLLEEKEKTAMPEEYTNENESEDTLRRLNDSRDYRYYDEETTSWKAWLVGVIIILVVLFLVVGVLARAGYLPFNVPFFSPGVTTETNLTPTPTPAPIVQATPTPVEASPSATVKKSEFTVQVQNGSGKAGAAGQVSKSLDDSDYDTVSPTNAPTEDYTSTEIYNVGKASNDFIAALIADLKKAGYSASDKGTTLPSGVKTSADVLVILGAK